MLEEVRINGLGVIDDAVLELSAGFTALTGETGAGKTMVVTALGLLFGGRADPARFRPGAERAAVEGRLLVSPEVGRSVEESGADLDEDGTALVLSRSVSAEGRSRRSPAGVRCRCPAPGVADDLVAVHGQADQQQLLKPGRQRDALDRFGGAELAEVLSEYRRVFGRHRAVREELEALTRAERERAAEAETLRLGLTEIEAAAPEAGEDTALLAKDERLSNATRCPRRPARPARRWPAIDRLAVDASDTLTLLGIARRLEPVRSHVPVLAGLAGRCTRPRLLCNLAAGPSRSCADARTATGPAGSSRNAGHARQADQAYGGAYPECGGITRSWTRPATEEQAFAELESDTDKITALADESPVGRAGRSLATT